MTPEWEDACDEMVAALEECQRRGCGISDDAAAMVDLITRDEDLGPVSVRHAARVIRREMPALVARARTARAYRLEFWRTRGVTT